MASAWRQLWSLTRPSACPAGSTGIRFFCIATRPQPPIRVDGASLCVRLVTSKQISIQPLRRTMRKFIHRMCLTSFARCIN
ncbi:hypothetical protein Mpe_A1050 [Methylibium petroleiphilum PM1]|uniref:Uncharacterized protein n=1 Tax=Methylibium petroleiphilum (strain ATCC BAA-1232 / LMG 22953 / PM1) TaxID=420662 RepID=A2SEM2_METPP|nr:hypothetical protein Mpe_A1050 [Methylibium petroleiphilum PM1]